LAVGRGITAATKAPAAPALAHHSQEMKATLKYVDIKEHFDSFLTFKVIIHHILLM